MSKNFNPYLQAAVLEVVENQLAGNPAPWHPPAPAGVESASSRP